jgi:hypothetical protein
MSQVALFPNLAMPQSNTKQRNADLIKEFKKLDSKKYTLDYRIEKVAKKFYLSPVTAYRIIKGVGHYAS